jgi:ABC-2 type transport system permease protein
MEILSVFFSIYAVYWIWDTLYAQSPGSFAISITKMTTYAVLGMAMETIFLPWIGPQRYISLQMKQGLLEMDLMKPIDFQVHLLARNAGETFFRFFLLFLPTLLLSAWFFDFRLPDSIWDGAAFLVSVLLAYLILFGLNFLMGMISIVTIDIESMSWAYMAVLRFMSGQMVPLWMYPAWLAGVLMFLPFQSIYYVPISLYIGELHGAAAFRAMGLQAIWVVILFGAGRWIWVRIYSKMMVQGG